MIASTTTAARNKSGNSGLKGLTSTRRCSTPTPTFPLWTVVGWYRRAVRLMPEAARAVAGKAQIDLEDIDLIVAHQANDRILEGVRKQLKMSPEKVPSNIGSYGNTTAGTLPILYHELRESGRVPPGTLVCFAAFGARAHYGAALYREPPGKPSTSR